MITISISDRRNRLLINYINSDISFFKLYRDNNNAYYFLNTNDIPSIKFHSNRHDFLIFIHKTKIKLLFYYY